MQTSRKTYLVTIAAVVAAGIVRWLLSPVLVDGAPFGTFIVAVIFSAWYGGLRSSLLAMGLGFIVALFLFILPHSTGSEGLVPSIARCGMYFLICGAIATFGQATRLAQHRSHLAEQFASQQAETLRITLASIGDAVITTDTLGRVTFINPVAQRLTGWTSEKAIRQPLEFVFHLIDERTRQRVETPIINLLRDGDVVAHREETVLIAKDGTEKPIEDSAAPIRGDDESIVGIILIFRDVTEARQALDARLRLAAIVESSDDAIISEDLNGTIVSWNRGAERLYGYPPGEIVGRPLSMLVPSDVIDELPRILKRLSEGERIDHYETIRRCKDGSQVNVSLTLSPIRNSDGQIVGASKIARDISPRKRMEDRARFLADASAALAVLEDYETTLKNVAALSVPFFADWATVDLLTPERTLNRVAVAHRDPSKVKDAIEMHRRFPPDPTRAHGIWNIINSGKSELLPEISNELLTSTIKTPELIQYFRSLGIRSYIGVPLNIRGQTLGAITFTMADSSRRYDDQDLVLANELAQRAAIAIDNARLYQNLKDADRRKDEFLATLAHELRNPLAPIRNGLEILRLNETDSSEMVDVREVMQRQVEQMVRLVDDLLDVSRISRNKLELRLERVELAAIVQNAIETSAPLIKSGQHQLTVTLSPRPIHVDADPIRLAQVFANLLNNSAKYTNPGGTIDVMLTRDGDHAVVSVKDSGVGIPNEMLKEIFQMFIQVDHSLERSQSGLGLGLTVVKRLVEMHGGTVEARSEGLGQGSEFIVRLPVLTPQIDPPEPAAPEDESLGLTGRRVLVVDDNRDGADTLSMLLNILGHETRKAYDGHEALAAAEEFRPQIVMLDIGLPKLNGFEVCRKIREEEWGQNVIMVALTGWGQTEDRQKSKDAGFDEHLVKPLDYAALTNLLAKLESSTVVHSH